MVIGIGADITSATAYNLFSNYLAKNKKKTLQTPL